MRKLTILSLLLFSVSSQAVQYERDQTVNVIHTGWSSTGPYGPGGLVRVSGKSKPWHAKYSVDLSENPKLESMKDNLPSFVFGAKTAVLTIGGIPMDSPYSVKGHALTMTIKDKTITGTFSDDYSSFVFKGGDGSKYVKVK